MGRSKKSQPTFADKAASSKSSVSNFFIFIRDLDSELDPKLLRKDLRIKVDRLYSVDSGSGVTMVCLHTAKKYRPSRIKRSMKEFCIEKIVVNYPEQAVEFSRLKRVIGDALKVM